jgi:hypothetical protein
MRWFHRYEVEHLLALCGFRLLALYGDFQRPPLADDSREMVFEAGLSRPPGRCRIRSGPPRKKGRA